MSNSKVHYPFCQESNPVVLASEGTTGHKKSFSKGSYASFYVDIAINCQLPDGGRLLIMTP
jgi:hypothetical protein